MSNAYENPVRANGRAIGYIEYRKQLAGWTWRDMSANGGTEVFDTAEQAEEDLRSAQEEAVERFGRDAHASRAR